MRGLSWNLRIVLGLVGLVIIFGIGFAIFYNVIRSTRNKPLEVDTYPGVQLVVEEKLNDNNDHFYYVGTTDPANAQQYATDVAKFYRDKGYECRILSGNFYENAVLIENGYVRTACLLDRSHPVGVNQSVEITIQLERTPLTYLDNDPQKQITGGGEITGKVIIDVRRSWGTYDVVG